MNMWGKNKKEDNNIKNFAEKTGMASVAEVNALKDEIAALRKEIADLKK